MSNAHDLAWCAGFFDGEGFVTIQERKSTVKGKIYRGYYLRIGVNHVAVGPLEELKRVLGGTIRKQLGEPVGNRHLRHSWQMSCQQAREALIKMMPYFRNKQNVAALGIELQNTMGNRGERTTEALQLLRAMLKQKISKLNAED